MRESSCVALLVFRFSGDLISRIAQAKYPIVLVIFALPPLFFFSHKHSNRV